MGKTILEVRNLSKSYTGVAAVKDVSLKVEEGEFVVILGPSGSGKSTLLMVVAGFLKPDAGEVYLNGELVNDKAPEERNVGMVFQSLALFPHMNVFDNVAFSLKMRRLDSKTIREKVDRILEVVQLSGLGRRNINELSGGQQQRVALARTLVFEPAILLLDEPFGALDKKLREEMQLELRKIHSELKTTSLLVTHDQREALVLADKLVIMNKGGIEQFGPTREVYSKPRTVFVADFVGDTNIIAGTIAEIHPDAVRIEADGDLKLSSTPNSQSKQGARATVAIKSEKIRISRDPQGIRADNILEGEIVKEVFEGTNVLHEILVNKTLLRAYHSASASESFRLGERVYVGWDTEDSVTFVE